MRFYIVFGLMTASALLLMGPLWYFRPSEPGPSRVQAAVGGLETYIRSQEDRVHGVKRDLAKGIVWFDNFNRSRTPISIVYLHGFSASRKDIAPVIDILGRRLQANVFFTRLAAHGLDNGEAFARVKPQDWLDDAREALDIGQILGQKVLVIGTSTGALLGSLAVLEEERNNILGLVMISPNFGLKNKRAQFISGPFGPLLAKLAFGKYRTFPSENHLHQEAWTHEYRTEGIAALMDLVNLTRWTSFATIGVPTLVLYTGNDDLIDLEAVHKKFAEIRDKRKQMIEFPEAGRHEFTGQALAPKTIDRTVDEIHRFFANTYSR